MANVKTPELKMEAERYNLSVCVRIISFDVKRNYPSLFLYFYRHALQMKLYAILPIVRDMICH